MVEVLGAHFVGALAEFLFQAVGRVEFGERSRQTGGKFLNRRLYLLRRGLRLRAVSFVGKSRFHINYLY